MAHRPSQRRSNLTTKSSPSHPPDLTQPSSKPSFLVKHLSTLNLATPHKPHSHKKPLPLVDSRLQAKAMTTSAIFESSKSSSNINLAPAKKTHKEKPQKPSFELERRKLHEKSVVKIEKQRNSNPENGVVERVSFSVAQNGGRRRSFCGSQVDLGDVFAINGAKMVSADMPPFMQIHAVNSARKTLDSMEKFTSKTLALSLKKEFDGVYGPAWHCIVGTSFGSFVTHSVGGFLYFSMDQKLYILLFKTAVQKAD